LARAAVAVAVLVGGMAAPLAAAPKAAAVKQVAASPNEFTSAALLSTGQVEVWGSNAYSEAGIRHYRPVASFARCSCAGWPRSRG
jgi:hypothetical protein